MKFVVLFLAMILYACGGGGGSSGSSSSYSAQSSSGSSSSSSSSSSNSSSNTDSSSSSQTNTLYITKENLVLKNGSTREILQVRGANPIQTDGGLASEERRTIYGYDVIAQSYTGSAWPFVEDKPNSQATIDVAPGITASFTLDGNKLKINDSFIAYQYTGDSSSSDASGDGVQNIWYAFNPDGTGTNTIGGLGNADNPTHRVTTLNAEKCSQADNIFFCSIPENVIGEFTFCAKYCNASEFRYEINDTSGKWSLNSAGVLSLEAQDYESMLVTFEQIDVKEISPNGEVIDYSVRFTITDVEEASGSSGSGSSGSSNSSGSGSSGGSVSIETTSFTVDENQLAIGSVGASGSGNLTYELSGTDSANISIDSGVLSFTQAPNFEQKNSYSFVLKITSDQSNVTPAEENISVTIQDKYESITQLGQRLDGEEAGYFYGFFNDLSGNGQILVLSSNYAERDGSGYVDEGVAVIYEFNSGLNSWQQKGNPIVGNQSNNGIKRVSISSDGSILAVLENQFDDTTNGRANVGRIQFFKCCDSGGNYELYGSPSHFVGQRDDFVNDGAFYRHRLSGDGNSICIGMTTTANDASEIVGSLKVYEYDSGNWSQKGSALYGDKSIATGSDQSNFGHDCDLSADGSTLAVGANNGSNGPGYVQIYKYQSSDWVLQNTFTGTSGELFGSNIDLNSDGTILAVASPQSNSSSNGKIDIYEFTSNTWSQKGSEISHVESGERLGDSNTGPRLSSDGLTLCVGASYFSSSKGQTRIYKFQDNQWIRFTPTTELIGSSDNDYSGGCALSSNGNVVLVNAYSADGTSGANSGTNLIYEVN